MEANETVEADLRVNTAKVHVEQQEALLRQTSSNPWFLFNQDVLALKDALVQQSGCSTPSAATVYTSFCVRFGLAKWRATF